MQILNDVSKYHNFISKRYRYINWNSYPIGMKPFLWKRNSTRNLIYIFFFCWYIPMLNGIQSTNSQRELYPSLTYITDKPLYHIWSLTRGVCAKKTVHHRSQTPSSLLSLLSSNCCQFENESEIKIKGENNGVKCGASFPANVGLIISAKPRVNPPTRNIKISRKKSATDQ